MPNSEKEKTRKYRSRLYPKKTLKEALQIAKSIQDNNAGEPYNKIDVSKSVQLTPGSKKFKALLATSTSHGLTTGSYRAEYISLTGLGRSIVAPLSDKERNEAVLRALERNNFFKVFFEKFNQNKLPRDDLLENTLIREFKIPSDEVKECLDILKENMNDWGMLQEVGDDYWLRLDRLRSSEGITVEESTEVSSTDSETDIVLGPSPTQSEPADTQIIEPTVFISHSKNKTIREQIETILDFGQFKKVIAVKEETTSIPIPEKVFGLMRKCNCAIINVSADEQEKNSDGSYRVNPNVLIEIGAAFLAYNRKVILLWDKRVPVPSNLQGLYRCEYEGDELTFSAAMKLQKAFVDFRTK